MKPLSKFLIHKHEKICFWPANVFSFCFLSFEEWWGYVIQSPTIFVVFPSALSQISCRFLCPIVNKTYEQIECLAQRKRMINIHFSRNSNDLSFRKQSNSWSKQYKHIARKKFMAPSFWKRQKAIRVLAISYSCSRIRHTRSNFSQYNAQITLLFKNLKANLIFKEFNGP